MNVILKIEEGPQKDRIFEFKEADTFLVGRIKGAHLRLSKEDRYVSRRHFMLEMAPPKCYIRDFGSSNGTQVNGKRIDRTELNDSDLIQVGRTMIRVNLDKEEEETSFWEEGELEVLMEEAKTSAKDFPAACSDCMSDLSDRANSDGMAWEFQHIAEYLCDDCFDMWKIPAGLEEIEEYRILQELGRSSASVVYKAVHSGTARVVVLKMIFMEDADEKSARRLRRGMQRVEKIVHPNLIRLIRQGLHKGGNYLISEFADGGNLHQFIAEKHKGPVSPELACKVITDVLKGLEHLHQDHLHRAIKPTNILLSRGFDEKSGVARLGDFGLAKSYSDAGRSVITEMGEVDDTVVYMAPEQILDFKNVTARADIYSVGLCLYELLTAELPFPKKGKDPVLIVLEEKPIPIKEKNPNIPPLLAEIADRAVRKNAKERFGAASEFRKATEQIMAQIMAQK